MKAKEIDESLLIKLYNEDLLSIVKCAEILGVSESCIRRILRKLKIIIRTPSQQNTHQDVTNEQVADLYLNQGLSIAQCAEKLNKSDQFIRARLKQGNIKMRSVIEGLRVFHKTDNITDKEIIDLYENKKMSTYEISAHFNKSPYFARQRLWAIDYPMRENVGEFNGSWKGGITPLCLKIRNCERGKSWKRACLKRDEYKCKISGKIGTLHVHHHPLTFSEIFTNFLREYPDLNPINDYYKLFELSQNYEPFWDVNNGITISKEIHKTLHVNEATKEFERVIKLHNDGVTVCEISKIYSVCQSTIRNILNAKSSSVIPQ
jgi:transposase